MEWGILAALLGLVINGVTAISDVASQQQANNEIDQQEEDTTTSYNDTLTTLAMEYANEKEEAEETAEKYNDKADATDASATQEEGNASLTANAGITALRNQQQSEGLAWNEQAMSNSATKGSELASIASSGTRNSSALNAVDMEAAVNAQQLQASEDSQRASDSASLAGILSDYNSSRLGIQQARDTASDYRSDASTLLAKYEEGTVSDDGTYSGGGSAWQLYQQSLLTKKHTYDSTISSLESQKYDNSDQLLTFLGDLVGGSGLSTVMSWFNLGGN